MSACDVTSQTSPADRMATNLGLKGARPRRRHSIKNTRAPATQMPHKLRLRMLVVPQHSECFPGDVSGIRTNGACAADGTQSSDFS